MIEQTKYYETKNPQFHQDAYAVLTMIAAFSNMWIMERILRPSLRLRDQKRVPGSSVPPSYTILKEMWLMVATGELATLVTFSVSPGRRLIDTGVSIFLGGYLIWNLDNIYCDQIRRWRHQLQLPWAVVLEGHAVSVCCYRLTRTHDPRFASRPPPATPLYVEVDHHHAHRQA